VNGGALGVGGELWLNDSSGNGWIGSEEGAEGDEGGGIPPPRDTSSEGAGKRNWLLTSAPAMSAGTAAGAAGGADPSCSVGCSLCVGKRCASESRFARTASIARTACSA